MHQPFVGNQLYLLAENHSDRRCQISIYPTTAYWRTPAPRLQSQRIAGVGQALGANSTCDEYAAVIKRITRQLNTSLRASQNMQISDKIA
jgi:uncharacterized protein involved in type VI secretion and phage assembly